jgi:ATP-dependent RNA helicase DeaD
MLEGRDVIAKAPTGTGKTMAFGIPIIEAIERDSEKVQAVILAPTRELAIQITDEMREVAVCHEGVRIVCLYGGQPINRQIEALKRRPQIVVATPGRLSDHMKRRTVVVKDVKTVVLDEADRMLDMGFIHDVTRILDKIPNRKNLGMFSATISREVMDISWVYQRDPEEITVRPTEENKPNILQYRLEVASDGKVDAIAREIGKRPVLSFGNSTGDYSMLNYAEGNPDHAGMGVFVVCDDTEREYGSDEKAAEFYVEAEKQDWTAFSMANDWKTIYGDGVQKTKLPGTEESQSNAA